MKPADAIELKKRITEKLENEDWNLIDLIFREYGVELNEEYNGNRAGYILAHLRNTKPETLVEIAEYLHVNILKQQEVSNISFWSDKDFKVFISHSSKEKDKAVHLKKALEYYNMKSFVAHEDIAPTAQWLREIHKALKSMNILIAILTEDFAHSDWTDHEVGYAFGSGKFVIPLRVSVDPYGLLGEVQALTVRGIMPSAAAKEIAKILVTNREIYEAYLPFLIDQLVNSGSYNQSREMIGLMELAPYIPEHLLRNAWAGAVSNPQVHGVPDSKERILELGKKFNYDLQPKSYEEMTDDDIPF
ncbi:MAG: toll/interleukin-1 receptor domain-containing protein [Spirochaetota bacterium]